MTIQSLESEMDKILSGVRWGDYQLEDGSWGYGVVNKTELIPALLKTVDKYVEERERLAREDEVSRIPYWGTPYDTDVFGYEKLFKDLRLKALRQQVKGGE